MNCSRGREAVGYRRLSRRPFRSVEDQPSPAPWPASAAVSARSVRQSGDGQRVWSGRTGTIEPRPRSVGRRPTDENDGCATVMKRRRNDAASIQLQQQQQQLAAWSRSQAPNRQCFGVRGRHWDRPQNQHSAFAVKVGDDLEKMHSSIILWVRSLSTDREPALVHRFCC